MERIIANTFLLIVFLAASGKIYSQTVQAYTSDGDSITGNIIDINASLTVKIQKESLLNYMVKYSQDPVSEKLLEEINTLNTILKNQVEIQKTLSHKIKPGEEMAALNEYSGYIVPFYEAISADAQTRKIADDLFREHFSLKRAGNIDLDKYPKAEIYVMHQLAQLSQIKKNEVLKLESISGTKIKLLAFVSNRQGKKRVHIENFDELSNDEFFEVERWVTNFSEQDKQAFESTKELSTQLNTIINSNSGNFVKNVVSSIKSVQQFKTLLDTLNSIVEDKDQIIRQNRELISDQLNDGLSDAEKLFSEIQDLVASLEDYSGNEIDFYNSIINQSINGINTTLSSFKEKMNSLPQQFINNNSRISGLIAMADSCARTFANDVNSLNNLVNWITNVFKPVRELSENSEELSETALEFSIDNLPEKGFIELVSSGKRENGDELQIKTIIKKPGGENEKPAEEVIEIIKYKLYQTGFYSVTRISLILAHPYNIPELDPGENFLETKFQFAPAASLLFKHGSTKSATYNELWNIGFGVNFSSPDFNLDGQPEFGAGLIMTTLKDFVSVGWSYNFGVDVPFVFIGLTMPVGISGPVNNIRSE